MSTFWQSATVNAFSTTLSASIGSTDTTIALNSVTGLQSPGILVIDRQDGNGTNTPTVREYISYTGISGTNITGVTRARAGSTGQSHNSGALVEEVMSIDHWIDLRAIFTAEHTVNTGLHVIGTATINYTETKQLAVTSIASIARIEYQNLVGVSLASENRIENGLLVNVSGASLNLVNIGTNISASGASLQGFWLRPAWFLSGTLSGASAALGSPVAMPNNATVQFISATARIGASQSSIFFDVKKNGTSMLASSNVLSIPINGTFASTSSIATNTFVAGDVLTVGTGNVSSMVQDVTVIVVAR